MRNLIMSLWARFDGIANADEVMEAKSKFENPKAGTYIGCTLMSLAPAENKDGLPVLKGTFKTAEGKTMYYYQNLQNVNYPDMTAVNVADAVAMVSTLKGEEIEFTGLESLATEIEALPMEEIVCDVKVFYGKNE